MGSQERLQFVGSNLRDATGLLYEPVDIPMQGSWNTFVVFKCPSQPSKSFAIRRLRTDVVKKRFENKSVTPKDVQKRLDDEFAITKLMALTSIAPRLLEVLHEYHPEFPLSFEGDEFLKSYIYIPETYDCSLHKYIFKNLEEQDVPYKKSAHEIAHTINDLCFQMKELDYCNLDIKLGNIVIKLSPFDLRFIDFDPYYMSGLRKDEALIQNIASNLSLTTEDARGFLRLFYGVIMILFLKLECQKAISRNVQKRRLGFLKQMVKVFDRRLRSICVPLYRIFDETIVSQDHRLINLIVDRCQQYNYMEDKLNKVEHIKAAFDNFNRLNNGSSAQAKKIQEAKKELKEERAPYIIPTLRNELRESLDKLCEASISSSLASPATLAKNLRPFDEKSWHKHKTLDNSLEKLERTLETCKPQDSSSRILQDLDRIVLRRR